MALLIQLAVGRSRPLGELWRYNPESQLISKVQVTLDGQGKVIEGLSSGDLIVEAGVDVLSGWATSKSLVTWGRYLMNLSKLSVVVVSALLLQACNNGTGHREQPSLLVSTFEVGAPLTDQFRSFNGQVMPAELTPLALLAGEIQQVLVEAGDNVEKGQLLATLDNATYLQDLTDANCNSN